LGISARSPSSISLNSIDFLEDKRILKGREMSRIKELGEELDDKQSSYVYWSCYFYNDVVVGCYFYSYVVVECYFTVV